MRVTLLALYYGLDYPPRPSALLRSWSNWSTGRSNTGFEKRVFVLARRPSLAQKAAAA
jgi:hypothetical protein